jgi:hypothetical protein
MALAGAQGSLRCVDVARRRPESRDSSRECGARTCVPLYVFGSVSTDAPSLATCADLPRLIGDFLSILSEIERNYMCVSVSEGRLLELRLTGSAHYRLDDDRDGTSSGDGMNMLSG